MTFTRLALKNIQGSMFRSWVVLLCAFLVAGFSLTIVMVVRGAEDSLQLTMNRLGADIVVVPEGAEITVENALLMGTPAAVWMPAGNVQGVAAVPGVAAASPQIYLSTMHDAPCCAVSDMFVVVYDPATDFTVEPWLLRNLGGDLGLGEAIGGRYVFVPAGEPKIKMYGYYIDLRGNLEPTGTNLDQTIFMNLETAKDMARISRTRADEELVIPEGNVSTVLVRVDPGVSAEAVATVIRRQVPGVSPLVGLSLFDSFRKQISVLLKAMLLILMVTAGLSVLLLSLVFSMAANERRRQIGVMRALGATRGFVLRSLLAEAASLALLGGAAGVALAAAIVTFFGNLIVSSLGIPFVLPSGALTLVLVVAGLALALFCVGLAAFFPAYFISRQDPALAMRE